MSKTLVVGDVHGMLSAVEAALATDYPVVFLGDYLDGFRTSYLDQVACLERVLQAQEEGRAVALSGNHERSYSHHETCSGFNMSLFEELQNRGLLERMEKELKPYHWCEGFLLSHAGVCHTLLDSVGITLEQYLEGGRFSDVGMARGGDSVSGGLFWCDWNYEFIPVEGVKQIVGHSHDRLIREKDGNYCIDCLPYDAHGTYKAKYSSKNALLIEDGKVETYELLKEAGNE